MSNTRFRLLSAFSLAALLTGCGGSSTSPSGGVTVIVKDGGAGPSVATLTITSAGINPRSVTVAVGQAVTIVNNDSRSHEIASDPHPQHGSCPSIEATGTLAPGQTAVTHAFGNAGTCGFHDHLDDSNQNLRGTIIVQ
jgi:plastocyanin